MKILSQIMVALVIEQLRKMESKGPAFLERAKQRVEEWKRRKKEHTRILSDIDSNPAGFLKVAKEGGHAGFARAIRKLQQEFAAEQDRVQTPTAPAAASSSSH
jgi:hypothetical protein